MKNFSNIGLRMTPQRIAVFNYLEGNKMHPSAEDVYKAISKKFPTMSFATVYNTLSALKNHGSLLELTIDPDKKRFDPNTSSHHHLMCINCRRILDVQIDYHLTSPDSEFEIIGNHVEFYGICPKCKGKKSERQR
jgi:Fur family transcriptional regulator, peroxide stress response regulator